jgi:hypothetical protein
VILDEEKDIITRFVCHDGEPKRGRLRKREREGRNGRQGRPLGVAG